MIPPAICRAVDALVTTVVVFCATLGVLLTWAIGDLPKLNVALALCALAAPLVHHAPRRSPR